MKNKKRIRNGISVVVIVSVVLLLLEFSCSETRRIMPEERRIMDSIVTSTHPDDSLLALQRRFAGEGNVLGAVVALRELGKRQRNESRFSDALRTHSEGLRMAESAADTIEMVQALNNIGTDYRRLGVLDMATNYHYRAWKLSEECTDTSFTARKNRVVSLNGLGNIYMTTGNYERADSILRQALLGEQKLGSAIGQAINYANIGSIFEDRGQTDSAWMYYRRSMVFNEEAGSQLGISLCHTNFGSLYEKEGKYDRAIEEYNTAYRLMQASKDEWHAMNSLIALAHIYCGMGKETDATVHLQKAEEVARRIHSKEHLAEIYRIYTSLHKRRGEWRKALESYVYATELQDSVVDIGKLNRIQNISLSIERNMQEEQISKARQRYESERTVRRIGFVLFGVILLALAGSLGMVLYILRVRARNHQILRQLNQMQETFFTNITHEFRTPLTLILGLSRDIGKDTALPEKTRKMGNVMERQGNSLLALINQLLDISKVKSTLGEPDWRHGDIAAYIGMIVDGYREYASRKDIELKYDFKGDMMMDFVPDYAQKMMNNLLSNAFKFTPEGGRVSVGIENDGKGLAVITVADTGKGIPPESLGHIFEPFYQAESDSIHMGTGVGLALVRQIVQSVGGEVGVESSPGRGTVFTLHIPTRHGDGKWKILEPQEKATAPLLPMEEESMVPADSAAAEENRMRLLVIEDNSDVAHYIGSRLSPLYNIYYAPNGRLGMEKARDIVPDLIITDLMMPETDGLEVCRQVRADELICHIPIVVITAKMTDEDRIKGLEAGADAYLCKPFNDDELRVRVEKLMEQRRLLREKFSQNLVGGKETEMPLSDIDRRFLAKTIDAIYLLMDKQKVDVNALAERLCMSSRQLHRKIQALTGDTPATYILHIKMRRARQLLSTKSDMSLEVVADRCGFDHYSGFYHAFKKLYGITPTQYRRGAG